MSSTSKIVEPTGPDIFGLVSGVQNQLNGIRETLSENYKITLATGKDVVDKTSEITYIELNNFFQLIDDIRENVSSIFGIILSLVGAGFFIGIIMLGDKVIMLLKTFPALVNSLALIKVN